MEAFDAIIKPIGNAPAMLHKRPGDARPYLVDLSQVLRHDEVAIGVSLVDAPGLEVGRARARNGSALEVHLAGGTVEGTRPHQDFALTVHVTTLRGSLEVALDVRVHAR